MNNIFFPPSAEIQLDPIARQVVSRTILIGGGGRTGTTMMGKLIHSLKNVEYSYEPSLLIGLSALIHEMPEQQWRLLYETYLFEDFLLNALAGRGLNLNPHDDSSFGKAKPPGDLTDRHAKSHRRSDTLQSALDRRLAIKLPGVLPYLDQLLRYYPEMSLVLMVRDPEHVINSQLRKRWYSEEGIRGHAAYWPYRRKGDINLPLWLPDDAEKQFVEMSEIERCCLYYVEVYGKNWPEERTWVIDYDDFMKKPYQIFDALVDKLACEPGDLTQALLDEVVEPDRAREVDFNDVDGELLGKVEAVSKQMRQLSFSG